MSFPNTSLTDLVITTMENRSAKVADNMSNNNGLLFRLREKGKLKLIDGGRTIYRAFSFQENANGGFYSGYDLLPTGASDVISGAEYSWKQYAVPVSMSGLEELQNNGEEQLIDLASARIDVAESTMENDISVGLYSDGTGSGGKTITGLDAAVPQVPTTGTYGGINRATAGNEFWRSQLEDASPSVTTVVAEWTSLWMKCVRGTEHPDLIAAGTTQYSMYLGGLQPNMRFSDPKMADAGFTTVKFMNADVVLDGGIGGAATTTDVYFLNTKYLEFVTHARRNFVPIGKKRASINQDSTVEILGWAGNLVCSGAKFQGRGKFD